MKPITFEQQVINRLTEIRLYLEDISDRLERIEEK